MLWARAACSSWRPLSRATLCRRTGSRLRRIRALHNRNRKALPGSSAKRWLTKPSLPLRRPRRRPSHHLVERAKPDRCDAQTPTPEPASDKSTPFQNAALRSAPPPEATTDQPTSSISTKTAALPAETTKTASSVTRPVVVLKPQERLLASLDHRLTTSAPLPTGRLATSLLGFIIRSPPASPTSNA